MTVAAARIAGFRRIRCNYWLGARRPVVGEYLRAEGARVRNAYLIRELDLDENGTGRMTVQAVALARLTMADVLHPWVWDKQKSTRRSSPIL